MRYDWGMKRLGVRVGRFWKKEMLQFLGVIDQVAADQNVMRESESILESGQAIPVHEHANLDEKAAVERYDAEMAHLTATLEAAAALAEACEARIAGLRNGAPVGRRVYPRVDKTA